jgi:hypothetical protein
VVYGGRLGVYRHPLIISRCPIGLLLGRRSTGPLLYRLRRPLRGKIGYGQGSGQRALG